MTRAAFIVAGVRSPIGKAPKGALRHVRPDDLLAHVFRSLLKRLPEFDPALIDDVIVGCATPEAEQGLNVARVAALRAGLPASVPAFTLNRFCASGLEAIAIGAERIMLGAAHLVLAGGVESMSRIPMGGWHPSPNPGLMRTYPDVYLSMGLTAENLAERYGISREAQDAFALESHRRAVQAIDTGKFREEVAPVPIQLVDVDERGPQTRDFVLEVDEGPRRDTSMEALAQLPPVFKQNGTVTAGNSSQTSDGAAAVLLASEPMIKQLRLNPWLRFVDYTYTGVAPEVMGLGPVGALRRLVDRTGVSLSMVDIVELNEAFAAQVLAVFRELPELDPEKVNPNGGAIALGHPLGCTGARQTVTLMHELRRRRGKYGVVTMCVGGGMGAAALFENVAT